MPKAKAAPATQEDLDVERYRLTADLAVADAGVATGAQREAAGAAAAGVASGARVKGGVR